MRLKAHQLSGKVILGCAVVLAILLLGLLWLLRAPAAPGEVVVKKDAEPAEERTVAEELAAAKQTFFAAQAAKPAGLRPGGLNVAEVKRPAVPFYIRPRQGAVKTPEDRRREGFLTEAKPGDALEVAMDHLKASQVAAGFVAGDFADPLVANRYTFEHNGVTHIYLRQRHLGIEVYNGDLNVNLSRDNRIITLNNGFVSNLAQEITATEPVISAEKAVQSAATHLQMDPPPALNIAPRRKARPARWCSMGAAFRSIRSRPNSCFCRSRPTRRAWSGTRFCACPISGAGWK